MKGIVFTEFLEMVEEQYGLQTVDYIISHSRLKSQGIYSAIGTYDFIEMQTLIGQLSEKINIPVDDLIYTYGLYFFKALTYHHPTVFRSYSDPFEFLASIENHIHVQVRKIYPGAELPSFSILSQDHNKMEMVYSSDRAMYMFAKALMEKSFEYYGKKAHIELIKLNESGTQVKFMISTIQCNNQNKSIS